MGVKYGANVDQKDDKGKTALTHAIENGHHEVVASLLEGGAMVDLDENGRSPLIIISYKQKLYKCC